MEWRYNIKSEITKKKVMREEEIEQLCGIIERIADNTFMGFFSPGECIGEFYVYFYSTGGTEMWSLDIVFKHAIGASGVYSELNSEPQPFIFVRKRHQKTNDAIILSGDYRIATLISGLPQEDARIAEFKTAFSKNLSSALASTDYIVMH